MDRMLMLIIRILILTARYAGPLSRLGIGTYDAWSPGKKLKLLIVGYNGARNTGADARTVAAVKQIRDLFGPDNVRITVLTFCRNGLQSIRKCSGKWAAS